MANARLSVKLFIKFNALGASMPASWTSRGSVLIRLARQHFAFYRGYLDGLNLGMLAERYLASELNASSKEPATSSAKSLLGWITQELAIEAEKCGQRSATRLLRLQPGQSHGPNADSAIPTLAEFQEERDPYHMYSEGELLELFEMEFYQRTGNVDRIVQRNRRLRRRQEALLQLIENHIRLDPRLDDPVIAWIDRRLANYLHMANIVTLGDLHATIAAYGFHWYRKVPRIGVKAAGHITSWLLLPSTEQALGLTVSMRGTTPPRQLQGTPMEPIAKDLGILPLERLSLPASLSGLSGDNRGGAASIAAENDLEAIHAWLLVMKPGSHTARACRKEAERFLLWCVLEARKPLSSVQPVEAQAYLHFLSELGTQSPQAWAQEHRVCQEDWLGSRGVDRWSVRWRPFEGPLSMASQRAAVSLLKSLTRFLHSTGYLRSDPFKDLSATVCGGVDRRNTKGQRETALRDGWAVTWTHLQNQPETARWRRIRVILLLLKETGCRFRQLASLRREALVWKENQLYLTVSTAGGQGSFICLSPDLREALLETYRYHGFSDINSVPSSAPLITAISRDDGVQTNDARRTAVAGVSSARIYSILKDYFAVVAEDIGASDVQLARRLRKVSANAFLRDG